MPNGAKIARSFCRTFPKPGKNGYKPPICPTRKPFFHSHRPHVKICACSKYLGCVDCWNSRDEKLRTNTIEDTQTWDTHAAARTQCKPLMRGQHANVQQQWQLSFILFLVLRAFIARRRREDGPIKHGSQPRREGRRPKQPGGQREGAKNGEEGSPQPTRGEGSNQE